MQKSRTSRIDESPSMASPLAMSSFLSAPGKDGFGFEDAALCVELLTMIPWTGEVRLSDAANVLEVPKGRLGATVNRLVKRAIMRRRASKGETYIGMTDIGRKLAGRLVLRDEDVIRKMWAPETDLTYGIVHVIMTEEPGIVGRIMNEGPGVIGRIMMKTSSPPPEADITPEPEEEDTLLDEAFTEDMSGGDASQRNGGIPAPRPAVLSSNDRKLLNWLVSPKKTQEVADHLGVSRQRAQKRLSALEAAGHVTATQPRARHSKFYQALGKPDARIEEEHTMISPMAQGHGGPKAMIVCDQCETTASVRCNYEHKSTGNWKPDEGQILTRAKGLGWEMVKGKHYCPSCKEERKSAKKAANAALPPKLTVVENTPIIETAPAAPPASAPAAAPVASQNITKPAESLQSRPVLSLSEPQNIAKDPIMAAPTPLHMAKTTAPRSPSTEPPREPTVVQNRQIRTLLDEVYDVDAGRYKGAESDITVADTLKDDGVMPGWVARIRETLYGSGSGNEEEETLGEDIKALAEDLSTRISAVEELAKKVVADLKEIEKDRLKLKDLQTRFDRWKANLGPKGRAV